MICQQGIYSVVMKISYHKTSYIVLYNQVNFSVKCHWSYWVTFQNLHCHRRAIIRTVSMKIYFKKRLLIIAIYYYVFLRQWDLNLDNTSKQYLIILCKLPLAERTTRSIGANDPITDTEVSHPPMISPVEVEVEILGYIIVHM